MKKLLALCAVAAIAAPTLAAADAEIFSAHGGVATSYNGTIELPTRFTDASGGFPGLGRRINNCDNQLDGVIAHVEAIDKRAWGGPFVIDNVSAAAVTPDQPDVDVDVYIYEDLADCSYPGATPITVAEYQGGGPGEIGFMPEGARYAVVFSSNAFNAQFTMTAYKPPVVKLASGELDITVAYGATVQFLNDTGDYAFVRGEDFDSSPEKGTGIRVGDKFELRLGQSSLRKGGTLTYTTSTGTGTITVTEGPGGGAPAA